MSRNLLLTISILISNRPDTVRKCLDSVKPLLDSVASELILVDTGCGEQVRHIIEEYTDKIVDFEWCNDFSKARNAGLRKAKGKWFLFLDDDEWFEDVAEFIRFFNSGEYKKYGLGAYTQRNYLTEGTNVYSELLVGRMVRLEPDIKFVYSIHENFNRVPGPVKKFDVFVHHYGYAFKTQAESDAHSRRNVSLLLIEHEKSPWNMKHTLQLAQEYNALNQYDKSAEMSLEGIGWYKKGKVEESFCLNSLFSNEIDCYIQLKKYQDAIEKGERYLREEKLDPLVRAVISGDLAVSYMEQGNEEKALEHAGLYWDIFKKKLANEEAYIEFVTIMTSECFEPRNRSLVLGNGVRAAARLGEAARAWELFQDLEWKGNAIFISNEMLRAIVSRMPDAAPSELEYYTKMCSQVVERKELEQYMVDTMKGVCSWHGNRADVIARYGGIKSAHWFFRLADIMAEAQRPEAERKLTSEEVENLAVEVWENIKQSMPYIKSCGMMEAAGRLGVGARQILERIPFYLWNDGILYFYLFGGGADIDWWNRELSDILPQESMFMLPWRACYSVHRIKLEAESDQGGIGEEALYSRVEEGLWEYVRNMTELCGRLYLPEILDQRLDVLPSERQAAYYMRDLLEEMAEKRYDKALKSLKEVRRLLPGMDNVMKRYLKWIDLKIKQEKQAADQVASEFQVLARQIKSKVRTFMDTGQFQAARSVVGQLQALLPEDEEVRRWQERLSRTEGE